MLPFTLIETSRDWIDLPLYPYCAGRHIQFHHHRPSGFPAHQVFLIRSGSGCFRDLESGKEMILEPGMALVIPAGRGHEYYPLSSEPWHVGFLGIGGSLAEDLLAVNGLLPPSPLRPESFEVCWTLFGDIWHQAAALQEGTLQAEAVESMSVTLYRLLLLLRRQKPAAVESDGSCALETLQGGPLQKAVNFLNRHYAGPVLISNIAAAAGYSVQHFQRLFVQEYGITPHKYLQNLRLKRALQLMKENPSMPVQEIALSIGMETNYFIRMFRGAYGCTPGAMRRRLHEADQH